MMGFEGKKIVVSGASSGIGREICISLSRLGAKVVLVARDEKRLQETISLMEKGEHRYISYDFETVEDIKSLIKECVSVDNIKLDGYVHCAGVPGIVPLRIMDYEKYERIMKINEYSYLEFIKHFGKKTYSNESASAVYLSSILTKNPKKSQLLYISSKGAADVSSKVLSLELEKRKIRVNTVLVGSVATKMVEDTEKFRVLENVDKPIQHIGYRDLEPKEVVNMTLFLLSDSAKYIIGENYYCDGGYFS